MEDGDKEFEKKLQKIKSIYCRCKNIETGFESMDGGTCVCEILYEHQGKDFEAGVKVAHAAVSKMPKYMREHLI